MDAATVATGLLRCANHVHNAAASLPQPLEPATRYPRVAGDVLRIAMPKVALNEAEIVPAVGETRDDLNRLVERGDMLAMLILGR